MKDCWWDVKNQIKQTKQKLILFYTAKHVIIVNTKCIDDELWSLMATVGHKSLAGNQYKTIQYEMFTYKRMCAYFVKWIRNVHL